jgi:hypothetical protein
MSKFAFLKNNNSLELLTKFQIKGTHNVYYETIVGNGRRVLW